MAVYDRWHLTHPPEGAEPCKCGRGRNKLYPSAEHPQPAKPGEKARRPPKRWQVRWYDDEGKQCKKNFELRGGGREETDPDRYAEAYDAKVHADLNADDYIAPSAGEMTLRKFGKEYRDGLAVGQSSLSSYDRKFAHIYGDGSPIANWSMAKLSNRPLLIQKWIKGLEAKGLGANYIGQILDLLSSIFIAAIDNRVCRRNPTRAKSVKPPTPTKKTVTVWTHEMTAAARSKLDERDLGAMVDLGVGAGLRQGEIFGVAETDIQLVGADRKLTVRRQVKWVQPIVGEPGGMVFAPPKGNKERDVPLSDEVAERLVEHIRGTPPVPVTLPWETLDSDETVTAYLLFVRPSGKPYHRNGFGYIWWEARDAAGADATPENGMHVLRHTYASTQLAGGVDIVKVSVWLGHESIETTTKLYLHFVPDYQDRGRKVMDAFLRGEPVQLAGQSALNVPSGASEGSPSKLSLVRR